MFHCNYTVTFKQIIKKKKQIGEQLKFINRTKKQQWTMIVLTPGSNAIICLGKKNESCACDLEIAIV